MRSKNAAFEAEGWGPGFCEPFRGRKARRPGGGGRTGSAASCPIDADADHRARGDDQNRVNAGNLFRRINDGEEQQADETTGERGRGDFGRDDRGTPRTLVRFGEMPFAARTGSHHSGPGFERANSTG